MKIKSIKGLEIELRIEGLRSNYKIIGKFRVEGKEIEAELDLQDWRTSSRNKTQYPGLYYSAKQAYIQISEQDYQNIKDEISRLPDGQKIIRLVKTTRDVDGYVVDDVIIEKVNVAGITDKNGSWITDATIKAVMVAEGITEITLDDFMAIYNAKYADKQKDAWEKAKQELRRQYMNDAMETGEKQALQNIFGSIEEKEESGDQ